MMNLMMPVMMGFISFNLPAGLGLYWAAGQVIWYRATIGDESHVVGARDAGDDGEAGAEEREIAIGF